MANLRETKKVIKIRFSYKERERLDKISESWSFETKKFMWGILKSHFDTYYEKKKRRFSDGFVSDEFKLLQNPEEFRSWQKRFEATGETNTKKAYEQLLKKEITFEGLGYLVYKLRQEMKDVVIPEKMISLMRNLFLAHLKKDTLLKNFKNTFLLLLNLNCCILFILLLKIK